MTEPELQALKERLLALGGQGIRTRIHILVRDEAVLASLVECMPSLGQRGLAVNDFVEVEFEEWVDSRDRASVMMEDEVARIAGHRQALEETRLMQEAERKGIALIGEVLGPEEAKRYETCGRVLVRSKKKKGYGYLISARNSTYYGKVDMQRTFPVQIGGSKCIVVRDAVGLPESDQVLNLALLCQADESMFWAVGIGLGDGVERQIVSIPPVHWPPL